MRLTTRLGPRIRATCNQARRESRIPAVCPPLVPTGGVVTDRGLYGFEGPAPPDAAGDFYLLTFNNGDNPGHVHWIVGAGRGATVYHNLFDPHHWAVPGHTRRLGDRRYGPWTITFNRFPHIPPAANSADTTSQPPPATAQPTSRPSTGELITTPAPRC
jgi:hypothetical protein